MRGSKLFALAVLLGCLAFACTSPRNSSSRSSGSGSPSISKGKLLRDANIKVSLIPRGNRSRRANTRMSPRYITIHSTQNWSPGADALQHAKALNRGALGRLCWHYTIDDTRAVQHLPLNETGRHADINGPGNAYSIGMEMCENRGNSRAATLDRTAKLTAYLMHRYNIPISRVVPHYHWPRKGRRPPNKNCPHFLLENGRPGRKWRAYKDKIYRYYRASM